MTSAIRRKQFDPETLRTCDGQPAPPRERRRWYDGPLLLCGTFVYWTIVACAVRATLH